MGGNFFKKLGRGANNVFKKIDHGASNFFKKLPGQVNSVVDKASKGLNQGFDAVGDVARKVGNTLEKVAPMVAMGASALVPGMAPAIMAGMTTATNLSRQIKDGARVGQSTTNHLAEQVRNKANPMISQAQQGFQGGMSNLQSHVNNALSIH